MKRVCFSILVCLSLVFTTHADDAGNLLFEYYWTDGQPVLDSLLNQESYPDWPDRMEWRTSLEGKIDWRDAYGSRVRGYLHPPADGEYTFWIASDDQSQLWLSRDTDPAHAELIARVNVWTMPRDFDNLGGGQGGPEQRSAAIPLEVGKKYYLEVLQVEGNGGDNLAVAWQGSGIPERQILAGRYLSSLDGLKGEYFNNPNLTSSPSRVRLDPVVDFSWGQGEILPGQADLCSVRWTGEVEIPSTETYIFYVACDDGARLWLDGKLLINAWWDQGQTEYASEPIPLLSGQRCWIRLEWYENQGDASCRLLWSNRSLAKQVIPPDRLSATPVTADLVGRWMCDEGVGGMVYDTSGNGRNGILRGNVTWTQGRVGKALALGGNYGDYVDLGNWDPSEGTGQLTVAHWLYWSGSGGEWQGTMGKRDSWNADEMMWQVELTTNSDPPGYINFTRENGNPSQGFTLPERQWVHVAVTFDGNTSTLYRDGQVVGTSAFSFGADPSSALTLGACEADGGNPWKGYIDDVRLYNRALTAAEVFKIVTDEASVYSFGGADLNKDYQVNLEDFVMFSGQWLAQVVPIPEDMVPIPGGTFQMGDSFNEGAPVEFPVHTVTLSPFYMSQHAITNSQYCAFLNAAYPSQLKVVSGVVYAINDAGNAYLYCDTSTANQDSQIAFSNNAFNVRTKGGRSMGNDPMVCVSWYGAAAYCNWRSHHEGRQLCYNMSTWTCDFNKNGYRLPTEAQREYAARGGLSGKRFPWGNTITHSQANYYSMEEYYDLSPTKGYHPTWNDGIKPYTSPVGFFTPNGYGLYDMAGNVTEWCNDWYGSYSTSPQINPTGPATGNWRVRRGGLWAVSAFNCRVPMRDAGEPGERTYLYGFRVVLDLD